MTDEIKHAIHTAPPKRGRKRTHAITHRDDDKARRKVESRSRAVEIDLPDFDQPSERRQRCAESFELFVAEYLPHRFAMPMSDDHRTAMGRMQTAVMTGGQYAQAAPRGDGKTERTIALVLWSMLYAHRRFVPVVAADMNSAKAIVSEIYAELADNELLAQDWPHICLPYAEVMARPNRARFLMYRGHPLRMDAKSSRLVFPTPHESMEPACGGVVVARGITSGIRGLRHTLPAGGSIRPDFVVIDDPQTDESAHSPEQCKTREALISGTLLGLAGPNKKIAAVANMTIIRPGDLAHRLLDENVHPEWRGIRFAMVYDWPAAKDTLWKQYAEMRRDGQRGGDGGAAATAFYAANRAAMDAGARVGWEHRKRDGELSALQCAFNLLTDLGEATFYAEYQNDPKTAMAMGWEITEQDVAGHLSGVPRGKVPDDCEVFTVGCDINLYGLNWVLSGWTTTGAGYVVDYGKFPPTERPIWAASSGMSEEQAIFAAMQSLASDINSRPYSKLSGQPVRVTAMAYDCGYKREAVARGCIAARQILSPSQVMPIRALSSKSYRPMTQNRRGDGWHTSQLGTGMALFVNADVWRERAQKGFLVPVGCTGGSVSMYGKDPRAHLAIADHICAEKVVDLLTGQKSGLVYQWAVMPGRRNDLLDALCYSMAVACYCGVQFAPVQQAQVAPAATMEPVTPVAFAARRVASRAAMRKRGFATAW